MSPPVVKVEQQGVLVETLQKAQEKRQRTINENNDDESEKRSIENCGASTSKATYNGDDKADSDDNDENDKDGEVQWVSGNNKKPRWYNIISDHNDQGGGMEKEEEVQLVGETGPTALVDFAHPRQDCAVYPAEKDSTKFCTHCYCYICDVAASECLEWLSGNDDGGRPHHEARRNSSYWDMERTKRKENHHQQVTTKSLRATNITEAVTVPENLFDFDENVRKIPRGCDFEREYKNLQKRAKESGYIYKDEETFLAAMELHNRKCCIFKTETDFSGFQYERWKTIQKWELREVAGCHRKPCDHCGHTFIRYVDRYYCIDNWNGPFDADKLCLGCMGRTLYRSVGANKEKILADLHVWRDKQSKVCCLTISNYKYSKSPFENHAAKKWYEL